MSSKNYNNSRHSHISKKASKEKEEIIELEEIPIQRQSNVSKRRKEIFEYTSSEATTPNKKGKKSKMKNNEVLEIMEYEVPEIKSKKKSSISQKKYINKEITNIKTRNEKIPKKSVGKLITKEKSPLIRNKKNGKVSSITLEESDNDNEIHVYEEKIFPPRHKYISRTPNKIDRNKRDEKYHKNNNQRIERNKNEEIIQCNLSSDDSESENENINERNSRGIKEKRNKVERNSGRLTSIKYSKKKENHLNENEDNITYYDAKDIDYLLGKKRKPDNKYQKSKTINNVINIYESSKQVDKIHTPYKTGATKSKTPIKNKIERKVSRNNNLMEIENENEDHYYNKRNTNIGLNFLDQLISEYGFEKVLDALCKPKLEIKNKLDSCLKGLIDSYSRDKLPYLLIKILFSYFESNVNEQKKLQDFKNKRALSVSKITSLKQKLNENKKLEKTPSKSPIHKNKSDIAEKSQKEVSSPININDEDSIHIEEDNKDKKENNPIKDNSKEKKTPKSPKSPNREKNLKKNNSKENKTPNRAKNSTKKESKSKKEPKKEEKKEIRIGSHYNKTKEGQVFRYQISKLDGEGNGIFVCYDDNCSGKGIYNLASKKFTESEKHNLKHEEHDYIKNLEKNKDKVINDLLESNHNDAQVFKENGVRKVIIY